MILQRCEMRRFATIWFKPLEKLVCMKIFIIVVSLDKEVSAKFWKLSRSGSATDSPWRMLLVLSSVLSEIWHYSLQR